MSKPVSLPRAARRAAREETVLVRVDAQADLERTLLRLLPRVRKWLYRLLGPHGPLDDAAQDALLELARALPSFEARSSVETFAHRITVRVAYRHYGKGARVNASIDLEQHASATPTPESDVASQEMLAKLHRCLARLPARRRTAFVLCALEGLSAEEAAEVEGTSVGSIRSRVMHAREELARMLRMTHGPEASVADARALSRSPLSRGAR
jgi:RNA polymerase sigma-70 factor (ECF subfamily)